MRLNVNSRQKLELYAKQLIMNEPKNAADKLSVDAKTESLRNSAIAVVKNLITPAEVITLKKFNLGRECKGDEDPQKSHTLILHEQNAWGYSYSYNGNKNFHLKLVPQDGIFYVPATTIPVRSGHPFWADWEEVETQRKLFLKNIRDRLSVYSKIITSCNTMKQLIEIWPEAARADVAKDIQLPAAITAKDKELIAMDMMMRASISSISNA